MLQPNIATNIDFTVGAELEFYLLTPEGETIANLSTGKFPQKRYSVSADYAENLNLFLTQVVGYSVTPESGPGQYEVQFEPTADIEKLAADINKFKEEASVAAGRAELYLSFEAKPLESHPGSSLHIHFSSQLFDPWGLVANEGVVKMKRDGDNDFVLWAIGGMLQKMPEDINIFVPTTESRLRIEPWLNAPTKICWGRNNRSTAIRIPDGKPKRIEHRVSGADADAKKVLKAVTDAAIYGIENKIQPDEPVFGNAWEDKYERPLLLREAPQAPEGPEPEQPTDTGAEPMQP